MAVIVLIWTIRPRAFRRAGRKEFTTARAPKTLTSNSCRIALSGRTSSGPGEMQDSCIAYEEIDAAFILACDDFASPTP